jgi:hypothetical protein
MVEGVSAIVNPIINLSRSIVSVKLGFVDLSFIEAMIDYG